MLRRSDIMDSRIALERNMLLKMNDGECFTIVKELARGGLCIVYDAFYIDNVGEKKLVRIKECYPFNCNIKRRKDQRLIIPESEKELFAECMEKVMNAYKTGGKLFRSKEMTNVTMNTYNVYHANNTLYIVSAYTRGETLRYETYSSVKENISIVRTVADVIRKMHNIGYLYLDIKPSNVFTLEGTTDLVQLFDFDTMVAIEDLGREFENKISFTKGFAPVEQQSGNYKNIGRHSDIYGIGALLFYLIFHRVPDAFDCERNATYDYTKSKLAAATYPDKLAMQMTEFFHKTLACYYMDRYSNMEIVIEKLSEMVELADTSSQFIYNSIITKPSYFFGRKSELLWISKRFCLEHELFAISGMGGIGKSTLVRECLKQNETLFDTITYLNYAGTIAKTVANDTYFRINGVSKDPTESLEEYFERKINVLREISAMGKHVIVIDNYSAGSAEELQKLRQLKWTIVLITRDPNLPVKCEMLKIGSLENRQDLLKLFEQNIGRTLLDEEILYAYHIFEHLASHTLLVEMIAKQMASPVREFSIKEISDFIDRDGFSNISPDKIQYYKDDVIYQDSIKQVIQKLFTHSKISDECRAILRIIVLFGENGIEISNLCDCLDIENRDNMMTLYQEGWIHIENAIITTHPVIAEAVFEWKINAAEKRAVLTVLKSLVNKLGVEKQYIRLAMEFSYGCSRCKEIRFYDAYRQLLFYVIENVSFENDAYIQEKGEEFIEISENHVDVMLLKVVDKVLGVYYDYKEVERAKRLIRQIKRKVSGNLNPYVQALYYYILAGYMDELLDGNYEPRTEEDFRVLKADLAAVNKAIQHIKKSKDADAGIMLGEFYRLKALLNIRSGYGKQREVTALLVNIKNLIEQYSQHNTQMERDFFMACAWYHTYVDMNHKKVGIYLKQAFAITNQISKSDQERIEEYLSPAANIFLECRKYDQAEKCLLFAIKLCKKHFDIITYRRIWLDMLSFLLYVYYSAEELALCKIVIEVIEQKIESRELIDAYIPLWIRENVYAENLDEYERK